MKKHRKIIITLSIMALTLIIGGCAYNDSLKSYIKLDMETQIANRFAENQQCLDKLNSSGLLDDGVYNDLTNSLSVKKSLLLKDVESTGSSTLKNAIIGLRVFSSEDSIYVKDNDGNKINEPTDKQLKEFMLSNAIYNSQKDVKRRLDGVDSTGVFKIDTNYDNNDALSLFSSTSGSSDDASNQINERLKCEVYVLNPSITATGMDEVVEYIKANLDSNGNLKSDADLSKYFVKSGEKLYSGTQDENVFKYSSSNYSSSDNKPGKDLVITQNGYDAMIVRLEELDIDNIDSLLSKIGANEGKYLFSKSNDACYLMEYPVQYIDSMSVGGNKIKATTAKSDIAINLYTQKVLKYDNSTNGDTLLSASVMGDGIDGYLSYLTITGADDKDSDRLSSFALAGPQEIDIEGGVSSNGEYKSKRQVKTCKVVLRDYLEGTYAPDYIDGSNEEIYAFGRKIRLNFDNISRDGEITLPKVNTAYFIDLNGKSLTGDSGDKIILNADSFMDINTEGGIQDKNNRDSDNYRIYRLRGDGETDGQDIRPKQALSGTPKVDQLGITAKDSIRPTTRFPGPVVDEDDYSAENSNQPIFYVMGTSTDMFTTKLYSSWIASESTTASLLWWNQWLYNCGYSYGIDLTSLNNYLCNNYSFKMSQEDVVILDLQTIAKIQDDMNEAQKETSIKRFKTVFRVLGWLIMVYAVILVLCWTIDTQLAMSLRLYTIGTFNKLVAIKYKDDIVSDGSNKKYVDKTGLIVKTVVMISVGSILVYGDFIGLLIRIVTVFGSIASRVMGSLGLN